MNSKMSGSDSMNKDQFDLLTWNTVDSYFKVNKGYQLVKHQLESFNDFVLRKLEQIIDGFNNIEIHHQYIPEINKFKYILHVDIKNPVLNKPVIYEKDGSTKIMTPNDARQRNFTYSSALNVDVHITAKTYNADNPDQEYTIEKKTLNNVLLGKIPIMVKSNYCVLRHAQHTQKECKYDYGSYFIINGNEKVVISQDRISENKTFVFVNNKVSTYSHIAEIRSVQENKLGVPKITTLKLSSKSNQFGRYIRVNIHHIKNDIPLFVLFKALGLNNDKEIIKYIVYDLDDKMNSLLVNELIGCIEEANQVLCPKAALEYLSRYLNITGYPKEILNNKHHRINIIRNILEKEFLPHVGKDFHKKALYLGYMVNKLVKCFLGLKDFDDRDSYINKRVDTPGVLMANLFRQYYGKVIKDMKNMISKEINTGGWKATNKFVNVINKVNIAKIVKSTIIDSGMRYALATGNWGIKSNKNKQGVAQVLNRMTYSATLSHLRRINTPIEKSGKLIQPRKLHSTQWGIICPSETPEGASVGLVKNMAMMASITISSNSHNIRELVSELGTVHFNHDEIWRLHRHTKVIINGDIIGTHEDPAELYKKLKLLKRKGCINIYTGIVWNILDNELNICTEGGRSVRPLYIVDDNNIRLTKQLSDKLACHKLSWQDLVIGESTDFDNDDSIIEFLDVEEANLAMVAMKYPDLLKGCKGSLLPVKYTHLEIHPSLILGVLASLIPFSDHNQAPRNTYQSAQCKQAIGVYALNYQDRYDTIGHILNSPQKPLVKTKMSTILNNDHMPNGINVIVAIATYTGFNQEDSIIMNKSAVDRGLFVSTYYKTYKEQNNKNHSNGEEEFFTKPEIKSIKPYNYDKVEDDGFVQENTFVQSGDIIIGKCMPNKNGSVITYKDNSIPLKNNERGFIDRNAYNDKHFCNVNGDGYSFCKVRVRSDRTPTIGDKFSSRSGQKGTCGILYRQEDMPFSKDGIVPDIIMNPHAIPSRMTIGQLLECIMGKACTDLGTYGDATPFTDLSVEDVAKILKEKCGLERYGNEVMYNSRTGEQMPTEIFIGPTYYQRLKHMTIDKVHSRASSGPIVLLTRQPAEGRARDGGLRMGEMEVECNWSHGILQFLKERIMECSDNYRLHTCKQCGMIANVNPEKNIYECRNCKNKAHFSEIRIPYACKLLFQEIQTMGIATRFITGN
jgi:DNA-directed RNA polymerase II subunit RPB2